MRTLSDPLGWFTLQFPDGWLESTEDSVTTLQNPNGSGIVYVSGGRHAGGRRSGFGGGEFLLRFLDYIGVAADAGSIQERQGIGCRSYSFRRESGGRLWRYWSITDDETALLLSYTCDAGQADADAVTVDQIVRSVRLYGSSPQS